MRLAVASMLSVALVLGPERTPADVYTWVDGSGTVHFSEEPPAGGGRARKLILPEETPPSDAQAATPASTEDSQRPVAHPAQSFRPAAQRAPPPQVELFTTGWCPHCKRARAYFQGKGIPFTEHDIEKEPGAAERLLALTGSRAIPTAVIGGKLVRGYSPTEYQAALGAH